MDRCVTGLIAQQQCVGPLHTPVADVAVTALSLFDTVGVATAIGEQPIKGLIDPQCGARMTVGEALTNLVFAQISNLKARRSQFLFPSFSSKFLHFSQALGFRFSFRREMFAVFSFGLLLLLNYFYF